MKLKNILLESIWDTAAKSITKMVFDFVKSSYDDYEPDFPDDPDDFDYEDATISLPISVTVIRNPKAFKGNYFIDGGVLPVAKPNRMELEIYIRASKEPAIYSELYGVLYEVIRHEVEHLTQGGPNKQPGRLPSATPAERKKAEKLGRFTYSMLPAELGALVHGFFLRAKYMRVPITKIFKMQLDEWIKDKEITKEEYDKLFDT